MWHTEDTRFIMITVFIFFTVKQTQRLLPCRVEQLACHPCSPSLIYRSCHSTPVPCPGRLSSPAGFRGSNHPLPREGLPVLGSWCHWRTLGAWPAERLGLAPGRMLCLKPGAGRLPPTKPVFSLLCAVRLILTAIAGSVGGIVLVAAWWRFGVLTLCMLCVGLVLGFLVSAVTFFTPLGRRCTLFCASSSLCEGRIWAARYSYCVLGDAGPCGVLGICPDVVALRERPTPVWISCPSKAPCVEELRSP